VHCCGYDSIPSDLGTLMVQEAAQAQHDAYCDEVKFFAGESSGGPSGGTLASAFNLLEEIEKDPGLRKIIGHAYALNPEGERKGPDRGDAMGVGYDRDLGCGPRPSSWPP
jgi:short subunit dehydrogenase-like uncharacterized protein